MVDAAPTAQTADTAVLDVLAQHGYEPEEDDEGEIALANCPFHRLAEEHRALVCGMNLDFLDGLLDGMGPDDRLAARLDPAPGYCCVRISTPGSGTAASVAPSERPLARPVPPGSPWTSPRAGLLGPLTRPSAAPDIHRGRFRRPAVESDDLGVSS